MPPNFIADGKSILEGIFEKLDLLVVFGLGLSSGEDVDVVSSFDRRWLLSA